MTKKKTVGESVKRVTFRPIEKDICSKYKRRNCLCISKYISVLRNPDKSPTVNNVILIGF